MEVSVAGVITVGPTGTLPFPGLETKIPLIVTLLDCQRQDGRVDNVASPNDFTPITTRISSTLLLYCRSDSPLVLRLTTASGASVVPINGTVLIEFPIDSPLTLLEVRGTGRIEYLFAGQV